MVPKDPVMLLSYVNTQLRDFYPTLREFCSSLNLNLNLNQEEVVSRLKAIDYEYDPQLNQFV